VARRPEIPEDVFFDTHRTDKEKRPATGTAAQSPAENEQRRGGRARSYRTVQRPVPEQSARVGRPPAQEGPKIAVTLYLTEPVAYLLEETRYRLLTEHNVRTSKSAIADFALRRALQDLEAAAEDLRRD
jgi:hypothetical protein